MHFRTTGIGAVALLAAATATLAQTTPTYQDPKAPVEARVSDLFGRLTQEEKLSLLSGTGFTTQPIPRLGVPPMGMVDAGQGVRGGTGGTQGPATLFPAGIDMARTWDPDLVGRIGQAIGEEARNKGEGAQVLLGPAVNIHRSPLGGRNGEYFSEDPFLAARLTVAYVKGVQRSGTAATVKHYAANNEEVDRDSVNVVVSERALREIYLPAFEAGTTEGGAWAVMSSYNQVNGHHSSANHHLLTDILKTDWGWDGMVMSDWGGVHETAGTIMAGNDLEMPGGSWLTPAKVAPALASGQVTQAAVDSNVRRILRAIVRVGLLDGPYTPDHSKVNSPAHQRLTYEAASEAMILLKNQGGLLPLDRGKIQSLAVIGPAATQMQAGAEGSPSVQPFYQVMPLDGIKKRTGTVTVNYVQGTGLQGGTLPAIPASAFPQGLRAEFFNGPDVSGTAALTRTDPQVDFDWPGAPATGLPHEHFSAHWTGTLVAPRTGQYTLGLTSDDGSRLYLNDKLVIDNWGDHAAETRTTTVDLTAGQSYPVRIEYYQNAGDASLHFGWRTPADNGPRFADAVAAAKAADVAIVLVTTRGTDGEGRDRPSMALPGDQDALIQAVAAANPRTVVVLNSGTPVLMPWLGRVRALLDAGFPGQEGGNAIAAALFGEVNPSGKLTDTVGARREDYPDYGNFPGTNGVVRYAEGIYVGYRHFDKKQIKPVFPFGYGLSYTTFQYSNLQVPPVFARAGTLPVRVTVRNTGKRAGAEVVELYVRPLEPKVDRPVRELKGFRRVTLQPGESATVTLPLDARAFSYYDEDKHGWQADPGRYAVEVGSSSRDLRASAVVRLP